MDDNENWPAEPPPSRLPGNRWTEIPIPNIGSWQPERRVTVVIPYYEAQPKLDLTLIALTQQTYPLDLLDVVVVDDGSVKPPRVPQSVKHLDVAVHVQEDLGFGLARARNLGASVSAGEILVFLDCDMIPERQTIEAHARWHHVASDIVVVGFRWHADFSAVTEKGLAKAVASDKIRSLLAGQEPLRPQWIERHMARTAMMTKDADAYFRTMSGGNLSIRGNFFEEIGGLDESFTQWGGEDNEFGFRAIQAGAVVIPDRLATCWHQGSGNEPSPEELESKRLQLPKLQNLIANINFRKPKPGCSYTLPYLVVEVESAGVSDAAAAATVESILASQFHDLVVTIETVEDSWLARRFASDGRVKILTAPPASESTTYSPLRIRVPAGCLFSSSTVEDIVDRVGPTGVGRLTLTVSTTFPNSAIVVATATRATNRAKRLANSSGDIEGWIAKLFGEHAESGTGFGIAYVPEALMSESSETPAKDGVPPRVQSNMQIEQQLAALRSRRSVRLADAVARLKKVKTTDDANDALRKIRQAFRRID